MGINNNFFYKSPNIINARTNPYIAIASINTTYTNVRLNISGFSATAAIAADPTLPNAIADPMKASPEVTAAAITIIPSCPENLSS